MKEYDIVILNIVIKDNAMITCYLKTKIRGEKLDVNSFLYSWSEHKNRRNNKSKQNNFMMGENERK